MATVSRQPFAPVDGGRLKSLASVKNRQNALLSSSPVKRKASEAVDLVDSENIAPVLFSKRSKGADPWNDLGESFFKPPAFSLTKAASSPVAKDAFSATSSLLASPRPRSVLQPKSPAARLKIKSAAPSPLTAPAGRSPTRGSKRVGILSRRRVQRPDPPKFSLSAGVPFSLDAALKGTIPSYSGSLRGKSAGAGGNCARSSSGAGAADLLSLPTPDMKSFWSFDIYEDTPEQEMTNLLQHGTCTLDISSDEESDGYAGRDRAEGLDKENVPPPEDVSQTSSARGSGRAASSSAAGAADDVDKDMLLFKAGRGPLAEMDVTDFYAEGCDSTSVFVVPGDEEDPEAGDSVNNEGEEPAPGLLTQEPRQQEVSPLHDDDENDTNEEDNQQRRQYWLAGAEGDVQSGHHPSPQPVSLDDVEDISIDAVMDGSGRPTGARGLGPIDGAGQSFELWESSSAKDEGDAPVSPPLLPDAEELP